MSDWVIGVIGGSGLYAIDALEGAKWVAYASPWGQPSDALLTGTLEGVKFVFLPRHGRGHRVSPGALNARANIDALKRAGCTDIVSICAVGSLAEALPPGHRARARAADRLREGRRRRRRRRTRARPR
jgi:5'-methylthioadenosine phosphorylase